MSKALESLDKLIQEVEASVQLFNNTSSCGNVNCTCVNCTCGAGLCKCRDPKVAATKCGNKYCTCGDACTCGAGCKCGVPTSVPLSSSISVERTGRFSVLALRPATSSEAPTKDLSNPCGNKYCTCGAACQCGPGCTCGVPADAKPATVKPADVKPADAKPADAKPAKGGDKAKKEGGGDRVSKKDKAAQAPASAEVDLDINAIDLRVGIIRSVRKHDTADKLYCEEIDVGEDVPRQIASGLVPYYTLDEMQGRKLIVVCNLKARNLVGFKSHGMVLCASKGDKVEFVDPPASSQPGDRISGEGLTAEAMSASQVDKKKIFEKVAPELKVDAEGVARWRDVRLVSPSGESVCAPTLRDAPIH
jgi:aminoacyl tRNA synthase complex-interacting multifunctional protein 1